MTENAQQKLTPIVFQGKAGEYFGIWIVNLLLSLVTLGIYSAWAKVRRKKYFYNNTLIENVGFDYHANPKAILKGRIIAVIIFALYAYGKSSSPILAGVLVLLFFLALPWLIVRGSIFNARNTSHRGLRFDFVGTLSKARRVFIWLPMLTVFTLGLIWPYIAHEKNQFKMSNHRFGLSQFDMKPVVKGFYKTYLIVFIVPFIGVLAAIAIPAYQAYVHKAKAVEQHTQLRIPNLQAFAPMVTQVNMQLAANEVPAEIPTAEDAPTLDAMPNAAEQAEAPIVEDVDEAEVASPEMTAEEKKALEDAIKKQQKEAAQDKILGWLSSPLAWLIGIAGALLYGIVIFGFLAYFQARISNLVWNNTTLDKLSFKSSLRARDFMWLYFSNMVAILCTFGLATPWAQIRMAKYRASKLHIVGDVDFDQFVGDKKKKLKLLAKKSLICSMSICPSAKP